MLVVITLVVVGSLGPFVGLAAADSDDNDSIATADPATVGGTISGTLAFSEEDYYQFEAQADQRITLVGGMVAQTVPRILVQYYGPDGATLGSAFTYTDMTAESGFIAPTTGTYYVRVETEYLGESAYSFVIGSEPVLDPYEPNGESAAATQLVAGSSYDAYRYYLDDDWYVYEATAGDELTVAVTNTALTDDAIFQVGCPPGVADAAGCADTSLFLDSQFYAVSPGQTRSVPVTATTDGAVYLLVYWGASLRPAEPVAEADGNPYRVDFSVAGDEPPAIDVTPTFLNFGDVPVGDTVESFLTVTNTGGSDLTVDDVTVTGTNPDAFTVTTAPAPVVAPGASTTVGVTFAPTAALGSKATLELSSNDPTTPVSSYVLAGVGVTVPPAIDVQPASVEYGIVLLGATETRTVTVTNTGDGDLTLDGATLGGPDADAFAIGAAPDTVVAPGATTTVDVTFTPTAPREYEAVLTVASDDPNTPSVPVVLRGVGGAPDIEVDRTLVEFDNFQYSVALSSPTTSASAEIIGFRNTGTLLLEISDVRVTGPDADAFRIDPAYNPIANPGTGFNNIIVLVKPPAQGTYEATVEIVSNDPDEPVVPVQLRATTTPPDITVSETALNFGPVPIAGGNVSRTVVVDNVGGWDLNVTSTTIEGDGLSEFSFEVSDRIDLGSIIAPGTDRRELTITYEPKRPLPATATLVIESDDPDEPRIEIALSGRGTLPNGNTPPGNGRP